MTAVFTLAQNEMLPAVCPACGAPGTRAETLRTTARGESSTQLGDLDAHYCDICADARAAERTRHVGFVAASAILVVAVATTCALLLGTRDLLFQAMATAVAGGLLPEVLHRTGLWPSSLPPLELWNTRGESILRCRSTRFARTLREHGFSERTPEKELRPVFWSGRLAPALAGGGLAWLALVHSLGGAHVRVIVSGTNKAVLLVDARHSGTITPTNAEDPRAGQSLRILGGRRQLELVSHTGTRLGGDTRTIWPGRTYIVGQLPPGRCLFWERRRYGQDGSGSIVFPVAGEGPVWELRDPVDSWFIPLESPQGQEDADWETSGGIRRAIRLLPCRGAL